MNKNLQNNSVNRVCIGCAETFYGDDVRKNFGILEKGKGGLQSKCNACRKLGQKYEYKPASNKTHITHNWIHGPDSLGRHAAACGHWVYPDRFNKSPDCLGCQRKEKEWNGARQQ